MYIRLESQINSMQHTCSCASNSGVNIIILSYMMDAWIDFRISKVSNQASGLFL